MKQRKGSLFTILELLLVMALVSFLASKMFKLYFKGASATSASGVSLSAEGIDTSNAKTIVDSTKKKLDDINTQRMNQLKEADTLR